MIRLSLRRAVLAAAVLATAAPLAVAAENVSPQTQKINELIAEGWKRAEIKKPADRCSDTEFIRRAFIDLIGRIATPEEVLDFEKDGAPNKRARLVNRLINKTDYIAKVGGKPVQVLGKPATNYNEEYAEHWSNLWTVWLMTRSGHPVYRERINFWLNNELLNNTNHKDMVTKLVTATGKSQENGAVNFIMYHLGEKVPADEAGKQGAFDGVPITSRVTRLFLGLQTQCTQCHDHPFNKEWVQSDFWGVNAYFRQTLRDQTPTPAAGRAEMTANPVNVAVSDDSSQNSMGMVLYEKRDGKRMAAKPIFLKDLAQAEKGETSDKVMGDSAKPRRQVMADFVTKHDNFARAYVNRIWGHLFGRGLNKDATLDDFGSHNEVVHPELLNFLGEEFVKYGYDPKLLIEWIASSDVYSLSHVANKEYVAPKFDAYFARMPLKAMSPEVLFESLMVATKAELRANADDRKKLRDAWMTKLVRNFGDDEGNELNFNGTVVQALLMMNGRELNDEIGGTKGGGPRPKGMKGPKGTKTIVAPAPAGPGAVAQAVNNNSTPAKIYDELFLMALNRHSTPVEVKKLEEVRTGHATVKIGAGDSKPATGSPVAGGPKKGPKGPAVKPTTAAPGAAANDVAYYQDVFWALLNSSEFILNH